MNARAADAGSGRPLLDKLGVKPGMRVAMEAFRDPAFEAALSQRGARLTQGRGGLDLLFYRVNDPHELEALARLRRRIRDDGAIWVLRAKGSNRRVSELDIIEAGKRSRLVDNKIASFSDALSAMRLVIPIALRG